MVAAQDAKGGGSTNMNQNNGIWCSLKEVMSLPDVADDASGTTASSLTTSAASALPAKSGGLPNRLVDFFCVVGTRRRLIPRPETTAGQQKRSLERRGSSSGDSSLLQLEPCLVDCFPKTRPDMEFPRHISTFCFPNGCQPIRMCMEGREIIPPVPILWTLVLTSANGHRLYGAVLTMYDETNISTNHQLTENELSSEGQRPVDEEGAQEDDDDDDDKEVYYYYLPKCLVVLSHYAFFDVLRKSLQQIYRIYKSGMSPLPLERYIANFCNDIPLPPLGRAVVKWECFTVGAFVEIARPPPNQLPLVNFSYEPLFRTLSVANVLVVWGVLLLEGRVALYSKHHALLTPVAEGLLSLLFPFEWQGIYVPVLPWGMLDVLDAPVPYVVGLDRRYWQENKDRRPPGVVFVDLDEDIVHLGWNDDSIGEANLMPDLPESAAMELKVLLEELTDHLFLAPACGVKGRITTADDQVVKNSVRQPYAQMTRVHDGKRTMRKTWSHRRYILSTAESAFAGEDTLQPLKSSEFILSREQRVTRNRSSMPGTPPAPEGDSSAVLSLKRATRMVQAHADRLLAFAGQKYATPNPFNTSDPDGVLRRKRFQLATNLYKVDAVGYGTGDDNIPAIRRAFLSFFVNVLFRYRIFLRVGVTGEVTMNRDAFIKDLSLSTSNKQYMTSLVGTQMFERFIHDRGARRAFFDEQIVTEKNRSSLFASKKQPTPFLDDTRWDVRKTIRPKAPCAKGVPRGTIYSFTTFPKLNEEEFVATDATDSVPASFWERSLCSACLCWPAW